jgi:geranylgeranyl pyrophosphate synthase
VYALKRMKEYQDRAMDILKLLPECSSRKSLEELIIFTTERRN